MQERRTNRPNVVFFFTDQQRWDTVGCYGSKMDLTPNLDRMASKGVLFKHAFTCQPVCGPARACIQTGKYATETGVVRNRIQLPLEEETIAHYLNDSGYEVGYIGKWHLAATRDKPVPAQLRGGYNDYWVAADAFEHTSHPYEGKLYDKDNNPVEFRDKYRVDFCTDLAIDYLRIRSGEQPFFLFLSYLEPHQQNDWNIFKAPDGYAEKYNEYSVPGDLVGENGDWEENLADYYGICKRIDESLGRLLAELERRGLSDDTLVIFASDHGNHFRTRNGEYKRSCHEASIRIPLVACGPGFTGGIVVDELTSLIDIAPTLLDVGGVEIPSYMRGHSLCSLVDGSAQNWPTEVFVQISEDGVRRALRTKRWKYCVTAPDDKSLPDSTSDVYVESHLYDLDTDPFEKCNLVGSPEYKAVCKQLSELLKKKMLEIGEPEPIISAKD